MSLKEIMNKMNYNLNARKGINTSQLGSIQASILKLAQNLPTMNESKWEQLRSSVITAPNSMGPGYDFSQTSIILNQTESKTFQSETIKTR